MKTFLLLLLLLPLGVCSQSFTVRGVVRVHAGRAALAGVTIIEKHTTNGTSSDAQGRFTLVTSHPTPRLVVSYIGYVAQEVAITPHEDSVVVFLREDTRSLSEVVVVGHATTRSQRVSGSVSALSSKTPGVMIRGARSVAAAPSAGATATRTSERVGAGILTAGEINDFSKWTLWPNIAQQDLREWRHRWHISPLKRYAVQLVTEDGFPVVGAPVQLKDSRDSLLWQAQSDNTGKCELWNGLFGGAPAGGVASLQAVVEGKTYTVRNPTRFSDGLNRLQVQQPCRTPSVIDVAFVVDATGSMGDEIQYLQAELGDVIARAADSLASSTLRLGSVFYRDAGDEYVTRTSNLSPDVQQTIDFIGRQQAGGGGDFPEAVEQALAVAVDELSWTTDAKARLLFLVLDAPPHDNPQVLASLQQSIRQAAAKGIRLIPITASGIDKSTEYLMRSMALATNGTYVFLTDDSGIGDPHLKPTTDQFNVERLNSLLVRLLTAYAYTTDCQAPTPRITSPADTLTGHYGQVAGTVREATVPTRRGKGYAWKCYPNPASDILHVEVAGAVKEVFITDVTGKLVVRAVPAQQRATIPLSHFPSGIYFLTFFSGEKWEKARFLVTR